MAILRSDHWRKGSALVLLLACASCGPSGVRWRASWNPPHGELDPSERALLAEVREEEARAKPRLAWELLAPLAAAAPENIELAVMLQELELELATLGLSAPAGAPAELAAALGAGDARAALAAMYVERKRARAGLVSCLLAARLEDDLIAARRTLDEALELDPACAWTHYALAHHELRNGTNKDRWRDAQRHLERALRQDPSHLRARRLEAWMLTQEGSGRAGLAALERWLIEVKGDPRVARAERVSATLDLARERLAEGEHALARELLRALEGTATERARRYLLLACAEHAIGDAAAALDAARRAEAARRREALPIVHQALLLEELEGGDSLASWRRVVERASASADVAGLLQVLRARVLIERRALDSQTVESAGAAEASAGEVGAAVKAILQRVSRAEVRVEGECVGRIGAGALVLLGVMEGDAQEQAERLAERVAQLRYFQDEQGRMNLSALDLGLAVLVVSQFTLAADCRKGRRPSFVAAARPELAEPLYELFCARLEALGLAVERGRFRAMMEVELVNDGPVTLTLEEPAPASGEPPKSRRGSS